VQKLVIQANRSSAVGRVARCASCAVGDGKRVQTVSSKSRCKTFIWKSDTTNGRITLRSNMKTKHGAKKRGQ
jgi:hypothetical protein